jgi:type III secretion protein J
MRRLLCLIPILTLLGCSHPLESGLSEKDAQEVVVTLRQHGIDAETKLDATDKKGSSWNVEVKGGSDAVVEAWNVLRENGLPRDKQPGLSEVFENAGMIPTAGEEKARLLVGLSGELASTLRSIAGVVDAHVNVVLPDDNPLLDKSQQLPATASVLLQYQGNQPPLTDNEVKSLVAKGVQGLSPTEVSVVMKRVSDQQLPRRIYGPLLAQEWILLAALTISAITGLGALVLVFVSQRRQRVIKDLERQLKRVPDSKGLESLKAEA